MVVNDGSAQILSSSLEPSKDLMIFIHYPKHLHSLKLRQLNSDLSDTIIRVSWENPLIFAVTELKLPFTDKPEV